MDCEQDGHLWGWGDLCLKCKQSRDTVDASDEIETLRAEIEKLKAERDEAREWGVQREFELSSKLAAAREEAKVYRSTLEKIADPRKRDHREPDKYTECACIMNMADEALAQFPEKKRV